MKGRTKRIRVATDAIIRRINCVEYGVKLWAAKETIKYLHDYVPMHMKLTHRGEIAFDIPGHYVWLTYDDDDYEFLLFTKCSNKHMAWIDEGGCVTRERPYQESPRLFEKMRSLMKILVAHKQQLAIVNPILAMLVHGNSIFVSDLKRRLK